uniref:Uncharacterized protein n=1 Tax=Trypanosoma congolense (strain IL3000) TaxID=1068625 RepID=G0USA3_TRYCI|nr:conserved hypothetical protein [Trypanosoma congolense IL3000]
MLVTTLLYHHVRRFTAASNYAAGSSAACVGRRLNFSAANTLTSSGEASEAKPPQRDVRLLLLGFRSRVKGLLIGDLCRSKDERSLCVVGAGSDSIFNLEWRERSRDGASVAGRLTVEEEITLLCELVTIAMKERHDRSVQDCFFASSPVKDSVAIPLRAAEATVAPLNRQVWLWSEQHEWQSLVTCAAAVFGRIGEQGRAGEGGAVSVGGATFKQQVHNAACCFLDKLESLSAAKVGAMGEVATRKHGKRRPRPKSSGRDATTGTSQHDTLPNTLWRLSTLFRLMESLLNQQRETAAELLGNKAHLDEIVLCILCELEARHYTIKATSGTSVTLKGLDSLLSAAFRYNCDGGCVSSNRKGEEIHSRAYKGDLSHALLSFCTAYLKLIPLRLSVPEPATSTSGDGKSTTTETPPLTVVKALHHCWTRWKSTIHLHGVGAAFWWLRLVPAVFEGLFDIKRQLDGGDPHVADTNNSSSTLKLVQGELLAVLCKMLYFDEESYNERITRLSARQAEEGGNAGGANSDGNDASRDDKGLAGVKGNDSHVLTRPRGGRSMLKKDNEGVVLQSSPEALRKSSRFASRRALEVAGRGGDVNSTEATLLMGPGVNSPLFDFIAVSDNAVSKLSSLFAVDTPNRTCALENLWLVLLAVQRSLQGCVAGATYRVQQGSEKHTTQRNSPVVGAADASGESATPSLAVPPFISSSIQHLCDVLAASVVTLYELSDPTFLRDDNIRRAVNLAIVAGTQGTLLRSRFYSDAFVSNWWLRSEGLCAFEKGGHSPALLERHLMMLVVQRPRYRRRVEWLKQSSSLALRCLTCTTLSPVAKQWAGSLIVSNLFDVVFLLHNSHSSGSTRTSSIEGAPSSGTAVAGADKTEQLALEEWAKEAFSSLIQVLAADVELMLLCGYASFIDGLFELHLRLGTKQEEMIKFGDNVLLEVVLPAVLLSLSKSAAADDAETHAAGCEAALFVLSELSRFATWPTMDVSTVLRTDSTGLLIHVAVYCLRHARCGGGGRPSGYGLPAPHLPEATEAVERVLKTCGPTFSFLLAHGNRCSYLHILDLSNRLLPFARVQPLCGGQENSSVAALQHLLRGLHHTMSSTSVVSASPMGIGTTTNLKPHTTTSRQQLVDESLRCLSFAVNTSFSTHVLGYLVRFVEHYLREHERSSRTTMEGFPLSTTTHALSSGSGKGLSENEKMSRESAMVTLARVEAAPLVLLDYMGNLSCPGSWSMVNWTFNLAETSLKIQRKHQLATATSVMDVAVRAILSQLRALAASTQQQIPNNILKSLLCIGDMMSESPVTLFGFDRGSPLQGALKHASRAEYRTMLFALKQAVLLVQRGSVKYRSPASNPLRQAAELEHEALEDGDNSTENTGQHTYFSTSAREHPLEAQKHFRLFLECLLVCFDDILDTIRWCALQQDVLDEELRDVLLLGLQTLLRVLIGCVRTIVQLPDAQRKKFDAEAAQLLWVGLCVTSALGKVISVDYGRICFTGNILNTIGLLMGNIGRLMELLATQPVTVAKLRNKPHKSATTEAAEGNDTTPLLSAIGLALRLLLSEAHMSHRLALRLGLGLRERTDFTAMATALRTLAAAAARYEPAGRIVQSVWRTLCDEVVNTSKHGGRGGKRTKLPKRVASPNVKVPSKKELGLLLESFNDLEKEIKENIAVRQAQGRMAEYVMDWACPDPEAVLCAVEEDASLLYGGQLHNGDLSRASEGDDGKVGHHPMLELSAVMPTTCVPGAVAALMEMDAALLLAEGEKVSNAEALEAFIRQCSRLHHSSTVVASNDTTIAIPQTARVVLTHFGCLVAIVERCTVAEIAAFPRGDILFGSLHLFYRHQTPVPLAKRHMLWSRLGERWREEFIRPYAMQFEEQQRELLLLVRRYRALFRSSERGQENMGGTHLDHGWQVGLPLCDSAMGLLARHKASTIPCDVELLPHDDIGVVLDEAVPLGDMCKRQQNQLPLQVPLDSLLTLLNDFSRGPRGEAPLEEFAKAVVTYVARHHIFLRPRNCGHAMSVWRFMPDPQSISSRVYQRRRLPLVCARAPAVAGLFFDAAEGKTIMEMFSQEGTVDQCRGTTICKVSGDVCSAMRSAEHGMFEYIRMLCLYLHVLALTVNVCHHFRILGSSGDTSETRGGGALRFRHSYYGMDEQDVIGAELSALYGHHGDQPHQDIGARLVERCLNAESRQADPDGVNANLLENVLLHFLNVSLAAIGHADSITHKATSIAVSQGCDEERARESLLYADEIRLMVAVALQDSLKVLLREAPLGFSLARRVAQRVISSFSCEDIPLTSLQDCCVDGSTGAATGADERSRIGDVKNADEMGAHGDALLLRLRQVDKAKLASLRQKRPELLLRSPTLLCVLSPAFFNDVLSQHIRNAMSLAITQVVASLHFYLRSPDARLGPLMSATTSILSCTYVRNAALRLFCEELCGQIVEREEFRDSLAPQTVASGMHGVVGSVPNEILIPFLAAITREDACVTKNTLALVLYRAMSLRPDVFGQPPTEDRFSRLAIARRGNSISGAARAAGTVGDGAPRERLSLGVSSADVVLESPLAGVSGVGADNGQEDVLNNDLSFTGVDSEEADDVATLDCFKVNHAEQALTQTHKRALASLNLTLAEVMETAMHFAMMRRLAPEEHKKATAMIRSADDARHERVSAFRSAAPSATSGPLGGGGAAPSVEGGADGGGVVATAVGHPDAALSIEEPTHFGVVMLHVSFALRKIIHVSMRRLAAQQHPKTLSMMIEMLREVDPKWHHGPNGERRRQLDGMLAGTLRVLVARALVCVDHVGGAGDTVGGGAGGVALSLAGLQRTERALYVVQRHKQNNHGQGSSSGSVGTSVAAVVKGRCGSKGMVKGSQRGQRKLRRTDVVSGAD